MTESNDSFIEFTTLPVMPVIAQSIIKTFNNPFVTSTDIIDTIKPDPAICARLIGLSNSAFFAQKKTITKLDDAVTRVLGQDLTRGIALGMALSKISKNIESLMFDAQRFWRDALTTALINQKLAHITEGITPEQRNLSYLAGLLSRVGILVLLMNKQESVNEALVQAKDICLTQALYNNGLPSHIQSARNLSEHWGLPETLSTALTKRHDQNTLAINQFVQLLQCSVLCCEALYSQSDNVKQATPTLDSHGEKYINELLKQPQELLEAVTLIMTN